MSRSLQSAARVVLPCFHKEARLPRHQAPRGRCRRPPGGDSTVRLEGGDCDERIAAVGRILDLLIHETGFFKASFPFNVSLIFLDS